MPCALFSQNQAFTLFEFEKQNAILKNSIRKRPFSAQESAKTQKSARGIFGQKMRVCAMTSAKKRPSAAKMPATL